MEVFSDGGSIPPASTILNETRFSNFFIEKRVSFFINALLIENFLFIFPAGILKNLQMEKHYFRSTKLFEH